MSELDRRRFLGGLGAAPMLAAAGGRRNVLLMIADDLGRMMPSYGDPNAVMPNMEKLAAEGVRFANAYCTTASCSASRSAVLSGLHNHASGHFGHAHAFHHFSYLPQVRPFPRLLKDAGYATGYIAKLHVAPEEVFEWDLADAMGSRDVYRMAQVGKKFIQDAGSKPWYLHAGFHDPHRAGDGFANRDWPHVKRLRLDPAKLKLPAWLPDNADARAEMVEYYEACNRFDQGIGFFMEVLKETGQLENTLVIVMSDHGPPFPGAKTNAYDAGLHLPLLVRSPDLPRKAVVNQAMVSWVDILPSVMEWTGVKKPDYPVHGRSWLPVLGQENPAGWDRFYFSHTFHEVTDYYPMRGVRTREYKYIRNVCPELEFPHATDLYNSRTWQSVLKAGKGAMLGGRPAANYLHRPGEELYDLTRDPDEFRNLAGLPEHRAALRELRADVQAFRTRTKDPWLTVEEQRGDNKLNV